MPRFAEFNRPAEILLVDDNSTDALLIEECLKESGVKFSAVAAQVVKCCRALSVIEYRYAQVACVRARAGTGGSAVRGDAQ